jgi:hypothetical protein
MIQFRHVLFVIVCLMLASCSDPSDSGLPTSATPSTGAQQSPIADNSRTADETDVAVFVLRWQLKNLVDLQDNPVFFVATARNDAEWVDPPTAVMDRIATLDLNIQPVSKARRPKLGEMKTEFEQRGVEDSATGKDSYIFWASTPKWIQQDTVEVDYGLYCGPLGGQGGTLVLEKNADEWRIKDLKNDWVS